MDRREPVPLLSPRRLVERIQAGEHLVFVDVREPEEFAEGHIPGALNVPQREFSARRGEIPEGADLVIPYCNLDFRGFVAARELEALDVGPVALMQERGIEGWRAQGLPVVEPGGLTDDEAAARLLGTPADELLGAQVVRHAPPTGVTRTFEMEVSEWYFDPNDLAVDAGDELRIRLTSRRGDHYFILPDYEIQERVPEGETREVAFVADRAGEFRFGSCEWDGASLQVMKGRLRVTVPLE